MECCFKQPELHEEDSEQSAKLFSIQGMKKVFMLQWHELS